MSGPRSDDIAGQLTPFCPKTRTGGYCASYARSLAVGRGRSLRLTDDRRRRLAAKGKPLGRKVLSKVAPIVRPDTIMAWYRCLIA